MVVTFHPLRDITTSGETLTTRKDLLQSAFGACDEIGPKGICRPIEVRKEGEIQRENLGLPSVSFLQIACRFVLKNDEAREMDLGELLKGEKSIGGVHISGAKIHRLKQLTQVGLTLSFECCDHQHIGLRSHSVIVLLGRSGAHPGPKSQVDAAPINGRRRRRIEGKNE